MSDESRADRLRDRRKQSGEKAQGADKTDETSQPDEPSKPDESVKSQQVGTYMYLPEQQKRELERQYNLLKADYEYEYEEDFEKNRHYYPLVIQAALEQLDDMDADDIRTRLDDLR